jgi:hypothetical protein
VGTRIVQSRIILSPLILKETLWTPFKTRHIEKPALEDSLSIHLSFFGLDLHKLFSPYFFWFKDFRVSQVIAKTEILHKT